VSNKDSKWEKSVYNCDDCENQFYITNKPNLCPFCGSHNLHKGSKKSRITINEYINDLNVLVSEMESIFPRLEELYAEYNRKRRVLISYVCRGLLKKEDIPYIKLPSFTKAYFDSCKKSETS